MHPNQKTWIDLLGSSAENCVVDDCYISRRTEGTDHYRILHVCDTHEQAVAVMDAWLLELRDRRPNGVVIQTDTTNEMSVKALILRQHAHELFGDKYGLVLMLVDPVSGETVVNRNMSNDNTIHLLKQLVEKIASEK